METRSRRKRDQKQVAAGSSPDNKSNKRLKRQDPGEDVQVDDKKPDKASPGRLGKATPVGRARSATQLRNSKRQAASNRERPKGKERKTEAQPKAAAKMDSASRRLKSEHDEDQHEDEQDDLASQMFRRSGGMSSALQGLLRRLGAGMDDMMPGVGGNSSRFKELVSMLQSPEEIQQLEALTQLCELLSISTEDSLAAFPVEQTVPLLVAILNVGQMPETLVLAARALTFLADVLPTSCSTIVRHEGVPALCMRLLTIEYIDLAEQSLQALEKLSHEHPQACLRNGALVAVLSFIDFFQTGVQRVAVATAANMCRGISAEHLEALQTAIPILTGLLQYDDAKVVDNACLALMRIADAFSEQTQYLALLAESGVVNAALQLVRAPENGTFSTQLSLSTYFGLVKFLATVSAGCASANELLLQSRISRTLKALLATSSFSSSSLGGSCALSSSDQLYDVLSLANILLPPIADPMQHVLAVAKVNSLELPCDVPVSVGVSRGPERQLVARAEGATQFVRDHPELLQQYAEDLLALLLQLYSSTAIQQVRRKCLTCIAKLVHFASAAMLTHLLEQLPMSSFISALLSVKDPNTVCTALLLCAQLLQKLPDVFAKHFVKEGVIHALHKLAEAHCLPAEAADGRLSGAQVPSEGAAEDRDEKDKDKKRRSSARLRKGKGSKEAVEGVGGPAAGPTAAPAGAIDPPAGQGDGAAEPPEQPTTQTDGHSAANKATLTFPLSTSNTWPAAGKMAQLLEEHYFGSAEDRAVYDTDGILLLNSLCERLEEAATWQQLCDVLTGEGPTRVSTFEFLSSGTPDRLAKFLQGEDITPYSVPVHMQRLHTIGCTLLARGTGNSPPMLQLVRKLHDCLAAVENLPVSSMSGGAPSSTMLRYGAASSLMSQHGSSLSSGLAVLSQPLKLRLCLAPEASGRLKDYGSTVVLVDPLASLSAVEDFLWPRVQLAKAADGSASKAAGAGGSAGRQGAVKGRNKGRGKGKGKEQQDAEGKEGTRRVGLRARLSGSGGDAGPSTSQPPQAGRTARSRRQGSGAPAEGTSDPRAAADTRGNSLRRMTRSLMRQLSMKANEDEAEEVAEEQPHKDRGKVAGGATGACDRGPAVAPVEPDESDEDEAMDTADEEGNDIIAMEEDQEDDDEDILGQEDGMVDHEEDAMFPNDMDEDESQDDDEDDEDGDGPNQEGALQRHASRVRSMNLEEAAAAAAEAAKRLAAAITKGGDGSKRSKAQDDGQADKPAEASGRPEPLSYAQAAGARGPREGPPPKLVFTLEGHLLSPTSTVFQAVQSQEQWGSEGDGDEGPAGPPSGALTGADKLLDELRRRRRAWEHVYKITYRHYNPETDAHLLAQPDKPSAQGDATDCAARTVGPDAAGPASGFEKLLALHVPQDLPVGMGGTQVLYLMRLLYSLNRLQPRLDKALSKPDVQADGQQMPACNAVSFGAVLPEEFISSKVSGKFAQQLKDVVALCGGSLPRWCRQLTHEGLRFLTPFELRRQYFYCTAFGMVRALQYLEQVSAVDRGNRDGHRRDGREGHRMPRLQRQKVRISRKRVLESAQKVMELYASHKVVLELEFQGEVGTGLGPTLEFYTLLSHELQRASLGIWRDAPRQSPQQPPQQHEAQQHDVQQEQGNERGEQQDAVDPEVRENHEEAAQQVPRQVHEDMEGAGHDPEQYVNAPMGLFPAPMTAQQAKSKEGTRVLGHFKLLGRAMAKALQDCRLLDLPLSHAMLQRVMGGKLSLYDIRSIDPSLGSSLEKLANAVAAAERTGDTQVVLDGVAVEDLCLSYEVPGYPEYALEGCEGSDVTSANVRQYIEEVVDATVGRGIDAQITAFVSAFNEVFDISSLSAFSASEVEVLLCGTQEQWTVDVLSEVIKFDHGFTCQSSAAQFLLQVLSELDATEQRRFLRFVTGSPKLPPGGLKALQPRLTVVRKHSAAAEGAQGTGDAGASLGASGGPSGPSPSPLPSYGSVGGGMMGADKDLPSVMTCANYIKLPAYTSKEVLKQRLLFAINEGQGSFDLS